jgi:hypothetical protein
MIRALLLLPVGCVSAGGPTCEGPDPGPTQRAVVLSTLTELFDAGTVSVLDLESGEVCDGVAAATADSVVRSSEGLIVQIDRLRHDRLRVFQPPRWADPVAEFSVGRGTNPHDAVRCGGRWLVSLYEEPRLGVYDDVGNRVADVDLLEHADEDGIPEASGMVSDGIRAWVALERLTRGISGFEPVEPGRLVEVDCSTWRTSRYVEASPNVQIGRGRDGVIRAWGFDGSVVELDEVDGETRSIVALGDPLSAAAFVGSGHGLVVARDQGFWHTVHCLSPEGEPRKLLATDAYLPSAHADEKGRVWIAVRRGWASIETAPEGFSLFRAPGTGLWQVDPVSCELLDEEVTATALPPFSLAGY